MRRYHYLMALLALVASLHAAPLDRIAVTVGTHVIAESEIVQYLRVSAFIDEKPVELSGTSKREAAEHLVDQYLIFEDATATRAPVPPASAATALLKPMKARYASDAQYQMALEQAQISESDLSDQLLAGLRLLHYTDTRFRPEVQISDEDLKTFYDKVVAARPSTNQGAPPTFEASHGQLEQLLTTQRTTEAMDAWLEMIRLEVDITYREPVFQ